MRKNVDLINGPIDKTLRQFTFPLAVSFIINIVYAWVDLFYVGKLGETAVAALGVSERIWFLTFAIGSGFAVGSGVILSRRIGENNKELAQKTAAQSILAMFLLGVILSVLLYFFNGAILSLLGISGIVKQQALEYFNGIIIGISFNFMIFHIGMIMRSTGNSFYPMMILIGSNIINAILAPLFIFGIGPFPRWEIFGAGFGTSMSQFLGTIWALFLLIKKFKYFDELFKNFKIDLKEVFRIIKVGTPASIQMIAVSITSMGLAANANLFGTEVLSTFVIGLRIDLFINMSIFAFGAAMEIISGQNIGAGKIHRIYQYYKSALKHLAYVLIPLGVLSFFGGKYVGLLFTSNPITIEHLNVYLKFAAFNYLPFAVGIVSLRVISGAGDYIRSLKIVVLILIIIQLPVSYFASHLLKSEIGIWVGMLFSMILFSFAAYRSMKSEKWLGKKV